MAEFFSIIHSLNIGYSKTVKISKIFSVTNNVNVVPTKCSEPTTNAEVISTLQYQTLECVTDIK